MEWTGNQQLLFLLQSAGVGMGLGLLFDSMTGVGRTFRHRIGVFLWDVLFGVVAALVTFFASLAIMDGDMHPLLFIGGGFGFLAEHIGVGIQVSRAVCLFLCWVGRLGRDGIAASERFLRRFPIALAHFLSRKSGKPVTEKQN